MSFFPVTIKEWQGVVYEWAKSKGWYDEPKTCGDITALIHTEISEAYEEYRAGHPLTEIYYSGAYETRKPEGFFVELADAVIRIFDYAEHMGVNLAEVMELKMQYNRSRPYRHGGKKA